MEMEEVEGRREGGRLDFGELIKTDRDLDRRERWDKIRESKGEISCTVGSRGKGFQGI